MLEPLTKKQKALLQILRSDIYAPQFLWKDKDGVNVYRVYDYQYYFEDSNYGGMAIFSDARSVGKCIAEGTKILNPITGDYKKVEDLNNQTIPVVSIDISRLKVEQAKVFSNGVKDCYRLKLRWGREIEATANHPFYTLGGWKKLKDIHPEEYIAAPMEMPYFGKETLKDDEVKFLAYMIGDGNCIDPNCRFTNANQEIVKEMNDILAYFDCLLVKEKTRDYEYRIQGNKFYKNNPARMFLRQHKVFNRYSYQKTVPEAIFKLKKKQIALFINRLFSCDGWAVQTEEGYGRVEYGTSSKELAYDLQHLLLRFSIISSISKKKTSHRDSYTVSVSSFDNIKFMKEIGIFTKQKKYKKNHKNRRREEKLAHGSRGSIVWGNLRWMKVRDIKYIGKLKTYNLTVENTHNFIANDVLSHNTEKLKRRSFTMPFRKPGKSRMISTPQEAHLNPVMEQIIDKFEEIRLTKEFIKRARRKPYYHITFKNGTEIIGKIPGNKGINVKGEHVDEEAVDECGSGVAYVSLADGSSKKLGEIVRKKLSLEVISYNFFNRKIETKKVINWFKKKPTDSCKFLRVGFKNYYYRPKFTGDHKFATKDGWVKARDLKSGDLVYSNVPKPTKLQQGILLGKLLGDSYAFRQQSCSKGNKRIVPNAKIVISQGSRDKEYVFDCWNLLQGLVKGIPLTRENLGWGKELTKFKTRALPEITKLYNLVYKDGRRTITQELLEKLSPAAIAFWFMDDGSCSQGTFTLSTHCFTKDENQLIVDYFLATWGIPMKMKLDKRCNKYYLKSNGKPQRLFALIAPYVCKSMRRKLPAGYKCGQLLPDKEETKIGFLEVETVEELDLKSWGFGDNFLYDIEVEDNHNYFSQGSLVSNSQDYPDEGWENIRECLNEVLDKELITYGVPNGVRNTFFNFTRSKEFTKVVIPAMYKLSWGEKERSEKIAFYGSRRAPGYVRNIYAEHGDAEHLVFIPSKLSNGIDWGKKQSDGTYDKDKPKFTEDYIKISIINEEVNRNMSFKHYLRFPEIHKKYERVWVGADIAHQGADPTEILIWAEEVYKNKNRVRLICRVHCERLTDEDQVDIFQEIYKFYNVTGMAMDATARGGTIWQKLNNRKLGNVYLSGYNFKSVKEVGKDENDKPINIQINQLAIETLRNMCDHIEFLLPYDEEIISDWMGLKVKPLEYGKFKVVDEAKFKTHTLYAAGMMALQRDDYRMGKLQEDADSVYEEGGWVDGHYGRTPGASR